MVRHLLPSIEAREDLLLSLCGPRVHFFCQNVALEWIWDPCYRQYYKSLKKKKIGLNFLIVRYFNLDHNILVVLSF